MTCEIHEKNQKELAAFKFMMAEKRNLYEQEILAKIAKATDDGNAAEVKKLTRSFKKWIKNGRPLSVGM